MTDQLDSQQPTTQRLHFDNLGNPGRIESIVRDALFWPDFLGLWTQRAAQSTTGTSVKYPSAPSPSLTSSSVSTQKVVASKFDRFMRSQPKGSPIAFRVPAKWSDLSLPFTALYFHWAAEELGQVNAFTLRLDADVEAQARVHPKGAADFLRRRIARRLKQGLDRQVDLWFVLENAKTGARGLHLHGELVASTDELPAVRKALRAAGGEWIEARQHQAHTSKKPADEGWIGYVTGDDVLTRKHKAGRLGSILSADRGFHGSNHYVSQSLNSSASKLYDRDRIAVIRVRAAR